MDTLTETVLKLEVYQPSVRSSLEEIEELDAASKSVLHRYLEDVQSYNSCDKRKIQAVIDYMYERINIGNWKEVKDFLRKSITIASYVKLLIHFKTANDLTESMIRDSFKIIDFGIMFGCPLKTEPKLLQDCAIILSPLQPMPMQQFADKLSENNNEKVSVAIDRSNTIPIEVLDCPSMEYFYNNCVKTEQPALLEHCIDHWPALTKWQDQNYFIKLAGLRTVSIELGKKYTDEDWTQKLMTIEEFIKNYIYRTDGPTGYLAQYQLFEQIPELKKDIIEPDYCSFAESNDGTDVMAWYGPKGTVSPLHHDPKKNLLVQVIGDKQVYLFPPKDSDHLYPHEHMLLNNTARVDPRNPDLIKYPKYKDAKPYYCVLRPGQMLYIPPKWWHFIESLAVSFSVSFWWE